MGPIREKFNKDSSAVNTNKEDTKKVQKEDTRKIEKSDNPVDDQENEFIDDQESENNCEEDDDCETTYITQSGKIINDETQKPIAYNGKALEAKYVVDTGNEKVYIITDKEIYVISSKDMKVELYGKYLNVNFIHNGKNKMLDVQTKESTYYLEENSLCFVEMQLHLFFCFWGFQ